MQSYSYLATLNAVLNGTSAALIATGVVLIKRGRRLWHKRVMIAAVITSSLFLVSYLYYHAHVGSVHFQGHGWSRPLYFSILISHTILAAVIVPFVLVTLTRGLRGRYDKHKRSARWTYPMWLYVSVTGVVIYVMLYHLFAA
jgi:putative membrane protein